MTRRRPNPPADRLAAEQAMREQRERERGTVRTAKEVLESIGIHEDLTPDSQRIITAEEQRAMAEALQKASVAQVHGDVPADVPWPPGQIRHGPPLNIEDGT